jgi:hypothetical protein
MTPEEKRSLFEKYDFSKTGLLRKAGMENDDPRIELYHDIAGMFQALVMALSAIAHGSVRGVKEYNILQDHIYKSYGWLYLKYQGIAWNEMDAGDPDLDVFFKMKQSIDDLGPSISTFLDKSRIRLGGDTDSDEYQNIEKQVREIKKRMQQYGRAMDQLGA